MKTPPPTPLFTLRVEAQDSSAVWPMVLRRDDPAMHDRIQADLPPNGQPDFNKDVTGG
jgi:hypothetical protein